MGIRSKTKRMPRIRVVTIKSAANEEIAKRNRDDLINYLTNMVPYRIKIQGNDHPKEPPPSL